ncbi:MAG: cell division topological specificity factor MinE [Myxococcota bacterium]
MFALLQTLFGTSRGASKDQAKQRLKLLLIHDQVDIAPMQLERMKAEILEVVAKYCEIDPDEAVEFRLNREDGQVSLVSTVPVRRVTAAG